MNKVCLVILFAALLIGPVAWASPPANESPGDPRAVARRFADALQAGRFQDARALFNKKMRKAMSTAKLGEVWTDLGKNLGEFKEFGEPQVQVHGDQSIVIFPGKWTRISLDMQVVVDSTGKITGLWFRPGAAIETEYSPPAYVDRGAFSERDVTIGKPPWELKGKLSLPRSKAKSPGVVLVHGSGPHDMDETIGPNRPFRDIAWGLASHDVVVLRYDKRTHAYGATMTSKDFNVRAEVIDDALAALDVLKQQPNVDPSRVFVLGHSLGGCVAPAIASRAEGLAGIIILSGSMRPMDQVIADQLNYIASLSGETQAQAKKVRDEAMVAIRKLHDPQADPSESLLGAPLAYWRDLNSYLGPTAAKTVKSFRGRVLIVGGDRDYQVTRKDFEEWRREVGKQPNVQMRWMKGMNHLYIRGEDMATPAEYEKAGHVDGELIRDLSDWMKSGTLTKEK